MPNIGYLDGQFMPLEELRVSPEDRGFQFGDGVYEVIRTYHGVPFCVEDHLRRLARSVKEIGIGFVVDHEEWKTRVLEGVQQSGYQNSKVYIQVTRGVAPRDHIFPVPCPPTVVMTIRELEEPAESVYTTGVEVMTCPDIRWRRCDIKSLNLLPNVLAKQQAKEAGAFEALFIRDGVVTEGASSNVMMVKDRVLSTPELNCYVLAGVTQKVVIEMAKQEGIRVRERAIHSEEIFLADELFLVGTTIDILPVVNLDGKSVGQGVPGPITKLLRARFLELLQSHARPSHP